VNSGLGNKHICLHDVVLWTVVASNLVGVAIIITISIPVITISVFARCTYQVEGGNATTIRLTQVNIILNRATKKVGPVVLAWVHVGSLRENSSIVIRDCYCATSRFVRA
jgi:hypothetical protein